MKYSSFQFTIFSLIIALCLNFSCEKQTEKGDVEKMAQEDLQLDQIPQVVMDALKAKFPDAEIHKWDREKEGDIVVYDFEFKQVGQNFEADIQENGMIHNWEKAIEVTDLPEAVRATIDEMYPGATLKEIMEITEVKGTDEKLEGYEVVVEIPDKGETEITIAPDGTILEDSGEENPE